MVLSLCVETCRRLLHFSIMLYIYIYIQPNAGFDCLGKTSPLHRKQSPESSILIQICIGRVSDGFSLNGSEARLVFHFFFQSIPPASRISFFFFFSALAHWRMVDALLSLFK
jgi:hypothetical protein